MDDRDVLGARLTLAEMNSRLARFYDAENNRPRPEFDGLSSIQKIQHWIAGGGVVPRCLGEDRDAAFTLLAPAGHRTVGKRGLAVDGKKFVARELVALTGVRVEFRRDSDSSKLLIFSTTIPPRFLCVARDAEMLESAERREEAIGARTEFRVHSRTIRKAARKLIRSLHSHSGGPFVECSDSERREDRRNPVQ